jgi:hypothetical protein
VRGEREREVRTQQVNYLGIFSGMDIFDSTRKKTAKTNLVSAARGEPPTKQNH